MKIYSIELATDEGRRVVQLAAPIEVDPKAENAEMPPTFRSLTEMLWGIVREVAAQSPALAAAAPKAEA